MENWGMITYKEQYLIGDENSHPREILDILRVTAHELGHQFFGKLNKRSFKAFTSKAQIYRKCCYLQMVGLNLAKRRLRNCL